MGREVKKLFLTSIAALFLATGTAHAAEIIVAVMQDTTGKTSIHHQALKDGGWPCKRNRDRERYTAAADQARLARNAMTRTAMAERKDAVA